MATKTPNQKKKRKFAEKKNQNPAKKSEKEEGNPVRSILVLKQKKDLRSVEKLEDCFILDFNPSTPLKVHKNGDKHGDSDLTVVAEKGQVACRDYPHSRHLCLKYPFRKTPSRSYCDLCYCYVCDTAAPCTFWNRSFGPHCRATDKESIYKSFRKHLKNQKCKVNSTSQATYEEALYWRSQRKKVSPVEGRKES